MASHVRFAAVVCVLISLRTVAAALSEASEKVDVTPDSPAGWSPSAAQRNEAPKVIEEFLADLDQGKYLKAYGLMTDGRKAVQAFDDFEKGAANFNAEAGPVIERRIVHISWTKDPANAPAPGVYVSVDLVSRFAKVDRDCGYVILYQGNPRDPFLVQGEQHTFLSNPKAREIQEKSSSEYVEQLWAQLATKACPNYLGGFVRGQRS